MRSLYQSDTPQEPDWGHHDYKDVIRDEHFFAESLPLPIVNYPGVYDTWLSFMDDMDAPAYFCSCQKTAMLNFIRINDLKRTYVLMRDSSLLEYFIAPELAQRHPHISSLAALEAADCFRDALCHKCNMRVPSVRWSNHGTHSVFLQHFGWYWKQRLLEYGIDWFGGFLPDQCPDHIKALFDLDPWEARETLFSFSRQHDLNIYFFDSPLGFYANKPEFVAAYDLHKRLEAVRRNIEHTIEGALRQLFGFPKRGKTQNHETLLYLIVKALFPSEDVQRHARPEWLSPLTFDIFVPTRRLAIEYQGVQHYKPMDHLGGEDGLTAVQERDRAKARLCREQECRLVYFDASDKLTEEYIGTKISQQTRGEIQTGPRGRVPI